MGHEIDIVECEATPLASVRRHVAWRDVGSAIREMLDQVYGFLREAPVKQDGHNVCIYHSPSPDGVDLEAAVQVSGPFERAGDVFASTTPAGRAAHTVHVGRYERLGEAHDALVAFAGRDGTAWEVYGDWNEDPDQCRTDVYRLLG